MHTTIRTVAAGALALALAAGIQTFGSGAAFAETPPAPSTPTATPTPDPTLPPSAAAHDHVLGDTLSNDAATPQFTPTSGVLGFDVSRFQGPNVDFAGAYSAGARFVYIKATESYNSTNDYFQQQWKGAGATKLIRGVYHFADPFESSGTVQANYFVNHGATWSPDGKTLPPVLDLESNPYGSVDGDHCWSKTPAQLASWVSDFSNTVLARTGIRPTIYTNTDFWSACMAGNAGFGANPLFFATRGLTSPGTLPASWSTWSFWQYADDSNSPAFPGDQDVFNGTLAQLTTFAKHATPNSNYVNALYTDYLGRTPGPTELAGWEDFLAAGKPRTAIAAGFVTSDEYRLDRIDAAYQTVLGRASDAGGRLSWLGSMKSGAITTDDIETSLYGSTEYYLKHGNTDPSFVRSLYTTLLHRPGSDSDVAGWVSLVRQIGRDGVVKQFWNSQETISQRISAMYQLYLGRVPDPAGLQGWVNIALQIGDTGLRAGFTSSDEYYARAQTRTF